MSYTQKLMLHFAAVLMVLLTSLPATAKLGHLKNDPSDRLSTIPHDPEMNKAVEDSDLSMVVVTYGGWRETLESFSRITLFDITGRTRIHGQDPVYTVLSMIYQREDWAEAAILPIEHPDLLPILGAEGKWVSPRFVAENPNINDVVALVQNIQPVRDELTLVTKTLNAVEQARQLGSDERVLSMFAPDGISSEEILRLKNDDDAWRVVYERRGELLEEVESQTPLVKAANSLLVHLDAYSRIGEKLLLVPDDEGAETVWVRPLLAEQTTPMILAGQEFERGIRQALSESDPELLTESTGTFLNVMDRSRNYTSNRFRSLQNLYTTSNPWNSAAWIYLCSAGMFGLYFFFRKRSMYWTGFAIFVVGLLVHSAAVGLRGYLKGHIPVSNIYESLVFTSWAMMAIAIGFETWSRRGLVGVGSTTLGFLLLVAAGLMPLHETRIHPLRAVLNSYWLNIHVTLMLISYAAFTISAFFAGLYLVRAVLRRETLFGGSAIMPQDQTEEFAYRLVQFGWPVLTFGIALGAVWADTAWGRFWGWDPKETWAFITWVGYTVYLHMRMVMGWRGTWSAAACVIGFVLVLITWLGVSYIPIFSGGLHSYASPNTF